MPFNLWHRQCCILVVSRDSASIRGEKIGDYTATEAERTTHRHITVYGRLLGTTLCEYGNQSKNVNRNMGVG